MKAHIASVLIPFMTFILGNFSLFTTNERRMICHSFVRLSYHYCTYVSFSDFMLDHIVYVYAIHRASEVQTQSNIPERAQFGKKLGKEDGAINWNTIEIHDRHCTFCTDDML